MAINNIDYSNLIKIDSYGLKIATLPEVRDALITQYKQIYGNDIDVSAPSADGQFINMMALITYNCIKTIYDLYTNLDVNTAGGALLERLCRLNNVFRRDATYSTAWVNVTYTGPSHTWTMPREYALVDKAGIVWKSTKAQTLSEGAAFPVLFQCTKIGPVEAPAGWIYQPLIVDGNITILQDEDAIIGSNEESDYQLRDRRNQVLARAGNTTVDSMVSALLEISGIEQVVVYSHSVGDVVTETSYTYKDSSGNTQNFGNEANYEVSFHSQQSKYPIYDDICNTNGGTGFSVFQDIKMEPTSVFIVIKYKDGIEIDNSVIGKIIFENLTPGVLCTSAYGLTTSQYIYSDSMITGKVMRWRIPSIIKCNIVISIKPEDNYVESTSDSIANNIIKYCNNLYIGDPLDTDDILSEVVMADYYSNKRTFRINECYILSEELNNGTKYKVVPSAFDIWKFENYTVSNVGENIIITINYKS